MKDEFGYFFIVLYVYGFFVVGVWFLFYCSDLYKKNFFDCFMVFLRYYDVDFVLGGVKGFC